MKTFEERYTAWIDGQLEGAESNAFEKELEDHAAAEADKLEAHQLGNLLKRFGSAPALTNEEFFNRQLMARIEAEQPKQKAGASRWLFLWPFARFAWVGAIAAVLGWVMARTFTPVPPVKPTEKPGGQPAYMAQIIEARTVDPKISASVVHSDQDNVTVLWLDGLEYLPASYDLH